MANERGNGKDPKAQRLQLRKQLSQLSSKQKLDALIDDRDAKALVRAMPAEELYFAIADVGLADATDVVQLAAPGQFRTFVDLGGWKRDRVDPHQLLTWIRAARTDDHDELLKKVHGLDPELIHFMLRELVVVHDLEEDPDVNPPGPTMETPEGRYLLELKNVEGAEEYALRELLRDLIAENPFESVRMIESTRWEYPSELEEIALRFRSGRLADLGFPPLDEALAVFTYVEVDPRFDERGEAAKTTALAAARERVDYLQVAVAGLDEEERDALEEELRYLANSVLVAEAADPGDLHAVRRVTEMTRDYLSMGLEYLSGAEPAKALDTVREHPLRHVFRVGFSLTLKLKFRADRLAKLPLARLDDTYLVLSEEADAISALRRKRPMRAMKVEGAEPMPFRSRRELLETNALLERAEQQVRIFAALLGGTPESARAVIDGFSAKLDVLGTEPLLLTAGALALLGKTEAPRPLHADEVEQFLGRVSTRIAGSVALRNESVGELAGALSRSVDATLRPELERMLQRVLTDVVETQKAGLPHSLPMRT